MKSALFAILLSAASSSAADKEFSRFIRAIHTVEAQGQYHAQAGDQGRAIGPLQIHYKYWADAVEYDSTLGGKYHDCHKFDYSVRVMRACLSRYAPKAMANHDWKTLARIHNGGPDGHVKPATLKYWAEVKKYLR